MSKKACIACKRDLSSICLKPWFPMTLIYPLLSWSLISLSTNLSSIALIRAKEEMCKLPRYKNLGTKVFKIGFWTSSRKYRPRIGQSTCTRWLDYCFTELQAIRPKRSGWVTLVFKRNTQSQLAVMDKESTLLTTPPTHKPTPTGIQSRPMVWRCNCFCASL